MTTSTRKEVPPRASLFVPACILCLCGSIEGIHSQVVRQATDLRRTETTLAALDDAGTTAFALSSTDPFGTNPDHVYQLFKWDTTTGAGSQITTLPGGVVRSDYGPSVSDDGQLLAFLSTDDPFGANADRGIEVFLIGADGTGLAQLTNTSPAMGGTIRHFALAGDGNRVVFESSSDYLGTNSGNISQLFVVETDGTGLRQVTSETMEYWPMWPAISDDGTRIAYIAWGANPFFDRWQVFHVLHDGTGRQQITSLSDLQPSLPVISGDGGTVAFETPTGSLTPGPWGCGGGEGRQIGVVDWDGSNLHLVTGVCLGAVFPGVAQTPDVTDDGQVVFFAANELYEWNVERVNKDATGRAMLTDVDVEPGPEARCIWSRGAGAGGRVAYVCEGGEPWGGPNLDLSRELYAMSGTGTAQRQLSDGIDGNSLDPDLTPDGARVVFASNANPLNEPGFWYEQIYTMAPDGSGLTRVTSLGNGTVREPSISDDGSLIVYARSGPPPGGYPDTLLFDVFVVNADGSGMLQLNPNVGSGSSEAPELSGDGSVVVFQSDSDLLSEGVGAGWKVYRVNPDGSGLLRLSPFGAVSDRPNPRVDATGTWVVYPWSGIHRQRTDGTMDQTIAPTGAWPDIESGGGHVVYASADDPLGTNPEGNVELFLWEAAGGATRQLTFTTSGDSTIPSFDRSGTWVWFWSDAPHFGEDQPGYFTPFRVHRTTGVVERVGGLAGCVAQELQPGQSGPDTLRPLAVDATGQLAVLGTFNDCVGVNRDGSGEVVILDRNAPARISVSPGPAPTTVSWDVESGPVRYDVIRGDLASLALAGGQVDLGAVTCIEDDSFDATTAGDEDPVGPSPGQGFFYLYRGSQGVTAGPGSYGAAAPGGEERVPASGDCPV